MYRPIYTPDRLVYNHLNLNWLRNDAYCLGKYNGIFYISPNEWHTRLITKFLYPDSNEDINSLVKNHIQEISKIRRTAEYEGRFWKLSENEIYLSFWKEPLLEYKQDMIDELSKYINLSKTIVYNRKGEFKPFAIYFGSNYKKQSYIKPQHNWDLPDKKLWTYTMCSLGMMNWGSEKQLSKDITNAEYYNLKYV